MTKVSRERTARPPRPSREELQLDKRDRIRAAAWQLFTTQGYARTTTKAVAARAGVAAGTLFLYASDKPDLLFLVMQERLQRAVEAAFTTLPARAPLLEQLLHVFGHIFRMYGEHPEVAREFVRALPGAKGANAREVDALTFAFLHRLGQLVRDAEERGEVARDVEPTMAAHNIFGLYFAALLTWLAGYVPLEAALDPGLRLSLALQIRGLRP